MTTTVAIDLSSKLVESPTSTSKSSASSEQSDEGGAFNKVLSEQTAKALEETDDGGETTSKLAKRSRAKSDEASTNVASTRSSPTRSTTIATAPGVGLSESKVHEDFELSEPSVPDDEASTKSTSALTTSLRTAASDVDAANIDEAPSAKASNVDEAPATAAAHEESDVITAATISTLSSLAARSMTNEDPKSENESDDDKTTSTLSSALDTTPSLVTPSTTLAGTVTDSLSDAETVALRAMFAVAGEPAPSATGSRIATAGATSSESISTTTSSAHRSDGVGTIATSTSQGSTPAPTWANSVRAVADTATSVAASDDTSLASSLDVADLASSISQAVLSADGSYTLNISMHPSDLGHVQAVVSLNGEDLHIAITPQTSVGHSALSNAVDGLKNELSRSGLSVNVSLRDPESQSGHSGEESQPGSPLDEGALEHGEVIAPSESLGVGQIHLIL